MGVLLKHFGSTLGTPLMYFERHFWDELKTIQRSWGHLLVMTAV